MGIRQPPWEKILIKGSDGIKSLEMPFTSADDALYLANESVLGFSFG